MRQKLIAGNWKMHGSLAFVEAYASSLRTAALPRARLLLLPPLGYLAELRRRLDGLAVELGVQNVHSGREGAYTGETSAEMAADLGATWALAGHSERRMLFGEDDETVADKVAAVRRAGLEAIVCVGETLAERDAGSAEAVVARQLDAVVRRLGAGEFAGVTIAYEPVWAIGTGRTATPEQAGDMHTYIRGRLVELVSRAVADATGILYGGSVKPDNAALLLGHPDIDGALVGGASLNVESWLAIATAAGP
jgi:triosephosphate isomerase (TIM)